MKWLRRIIAAVRRNVDELTNEGGPARWADRYEGSDHG
jgi:hypothetical protein